MTTRAILFDIDGTLVDSNALHVDAWHQALAEHGHVVTKQRIAAQIGKGGDHLLPALIPGISDDDIEQLGKGHDRIFRRDGLPRVKPFPQAHELLRHAARRGLRLVLASSSNQAEVKHYIQMLDADALLECSTSADDVESSKPAPDIFAVSLKKLGNLTAAEVAVIGDTPYDIEAAHGCGLRTVAVRSGGFDDATLSGAGAVAIADDVADVLRRFDELFPA